MRAAAGDADQVVVHGAVVVVLDRRSGQDGSTFSVRFVSHGRCRRKTHAVHWWLFYLATHATPSAKQDWILMYPSHPSYRPPLSCSGNAKVFWIVDSLVRIGTEISARTSTKRSICKQRGDGRIIGPSKANAFCAISATGHLVRQSELMRRRRWRHQHGVAVATMTTSTWGCGSDDADINTGL